MRFAAIFAAFGSILFSLATPSLAAPSFDCARAQTPVERMICASPELSDLDAELGRVYAARRMTLTAGEVAAMKQAQRQWLKQTSTCRDAYCVKQAYEERLRELGAGDQAAASDEERRDVLVGERPYETLTITGKKDLGSEDAEISYAFTAADAKTQCEALNGDDPVDQCVTKVMQQEQDNDGGMRGTIVANCRTGIFTDPGGEVYAFVREDSDGRTDLAIRDLGNKQIMDGSTASGYGSAVDSFAALCPAVGERLNWMATSAEHQSDAERASDADAEPPALPDGAGAMQPEDFELDRRKLTGRVVAIEGLVWCPSVDRCVVASKQNGMIMVPFATEQLDHDLRRLLLACSAAKSCDTAVAGVAENGRGTHLIARGVALRR